MPEQGGCIAFCRRLQARVAGMAEGGYQIIHSRQEGMTESEMRNLPVVMHETPMRARNRPGATGKILLSQFVTLAPLIFIASIYTAFTFCYPMASKTLSLVTPHCLSSGSGLSVVGIMTNEAPMCASSRHSLVSYEACHIVSMR